MKIALLVNSLVSGGTERRLVELIKGLKDYPDVTLQLVVFSDKIHYTEIYDFGVPITIIRREPKRNPMVFYKLYKVCKQWRPDIIHSWGTMAAILALPSVIFLRIKFINGYVVNASQNTKFFGEWLLRARLSFPFSDVIVGNSEAGLKAYNVSKEKGVCIYNGFNAERIAELKDEGSIRKKFNIKSDQVIGMVASFTDRKAYDILIKAGILVLEQGKKVTFVLVGHGETMAACKELIPTDRSANFVFTGEQKDVESIINIFDIGVLATNTKIHGEGISNAILENMALGKPVVATSGGGTNEIIVQGETGFLIPADSPKAMSERLIHLLDNTDTAIVMGNKGRHRIKEVFSIEKMIKAYYELYRTVLN